jgi:ribokinase
MLVVLCDLIVDISMHLPHFPVEPGGLHRLSYLDMGPGGACNTAIMAARFGLPVTCLGEVGDDAFGHLVLDGLKIERIDTANVQITAGAGTPVAAVLVDEAAEPAYLGAPGSLRLDHLPDYWWPVIHNASALYADGWAAHAGVPHILRAGFERARVAEIPVFFDPGPGNPDVPEDWLPGVMPHVTVLLVNEEEAIRISGQPGTDAAARHLLAQGPELIVLKRGARGCVLYRGDQRVAVSGFPTEVVDHTGAGDSLSAAIIYAYGAGCTLEQMGQLGNATGAAKVARRGTGRNMPTLQEIRAILEQHDQPTNILPESSPP